jgi:hypothetical protein
MAQSDLDNPVRQGVARWGGRLLLLSAWVFPFATARAGLTESDVLLLVNDNSPASQSVAEMYRQYHPGIADNQIVHLTGLTDSCGPGSTAAGEIISRNDFNTKIADPVRQYLVNNNMVNSTKVIITTAGMPYRIQDTNNGNIVQPGASSTYSTPMTVNAASVESELSVLFQIDPASPRPLPLYNRVGNPYQGYRSSFDSFSRDILNNRGNMNWNYPTITKYTPPFLDGVPSGSYGGMLDRHFSPGDIYLTCRLDGPKVQGGRPDYEVLYMLERAWRASNPEYGIAASQAVTVFDDTPRSDNPNRNPLYNLSSGVPYLTYDPNDPQPDDIITADIRDDYSSGYRQMTGRTALNNTFNSSTMAMGHGLQVIDDTRTGHRTSQADLASDKTVVALSGYGVNGDEGSSSGYLLTGGPSGGHLFNLGFGAVFTSMESYNAVTLFSDVSTGPVAQGKIVDFLSMGGSGAIGHCFEPVSDAGIDNEFLFYNLLADADGDGIADMTFIEAAFSAMPFLSWSEVVLGDPLMRIAYGPGGSATGFPVPVPEPASLMLAAGAWLIRSQLKGREGNK